MKKWLKSGFYIVTETAQRKTNAKQLVILFLEHNKYNIHSNRLSTAYNTLNLNLQLKEEATYFLYTDD